MARRVVLSKLARSDERSKIYQFCEIKSDNFKELAALKKILLNNRKTLVERYISDFDKMYNTHLD